MEVLAAAGVAEAMGVIAARRWDGAGVWMVGLAATAVEAVSIRLLFVGGAGQTVPKMVTRPVMGLISLPLHLVWPRRTCLSATFFLSKHRLHLPHWKAAISPLVSKKPSVSPEWLRWKRLWFTRRHFSASWAQSAMEVMEELSKHDGWSRLCCAICQDRREAWECCLRRVLQTTQPKSMWVAPIGCICFVWKSWVELRVHQHLQM